MAIRAKLAIGAVPDCKIKELEQKAQEDYLLALSGETNYTCGEQACHYCTTCSSDTISCTRIVVLEDGPNELMVMPISNSVCYEAGSPNIWRTSLIFDISYLNPSTVLTGIITVVALDGTNTIITEQTGLVFNTLTHYWELDFKAEDILSTNTGEMKVIYTISDGTSTILSSQYIQLDNKNLC